MKLNYIFKLFTFIGLCQAQNIIYCQKNTDCLSNYQCKEIISKGCLDCRNNCNIYGYCNCPCYQCIKKT